MAGFEENNKARKSEYAIIGLYFQYKTQKTT